MDVCYQGCVNDIIRLVHYRSEIFGGGKLPRIKITVTNVMFKVLIALGKTNDLYCHTLGKTPSLFRHDLNGLHSKQSDRLTISMNAMHKIPSKFVPKKFALSSKVANTRGTSKCCVGRNPYNGYKYLCGSTPNGVFLMQWYDPLNKFMLLKVCNQQNYLSCSINN